MKVLTPLGIAITLFFGMALDSGQPSYGLALNWCISGLCIALVGLAIEIIKERKRTHKSYNSYKFK